MITIRSMACRFFVLLFILAANVAYAQPQLNVGPFGPGTIDGSPPFKTDGECVSSNAIANAGDDCGESNGQVRSQDIVTHVWSVTANNYAAGAANLKNVVFEQILHPSTHAVIQFESLPVICTPTAGGGTNPPSSIDNLPDGTIRLTCNLGEFSEGQQRSFSSVVKISGDSLNGETYTSEQRVYSLDENGQPNAAGDTSPTVGPIQISAAPAFDLIAGKWRTNYIGSRDVDGDGVAEQGYYDYFVVKLASHKRVGIEAITQPFSFTSEITAQIGAENGPDYTTANGFEFYVTDCRPNPSNWSEELYGLEGYYPSYAETPMANVTNSGTCTFSRNDPADNASPYTFTVQGADLSGTRYPTRTIGGADLVPGPYYSVAHRVQVFIPFRSIDKADGNLNDSQGAIYIKNTLKGFDPAGVSGTSNYGNGVEPGYNGTPMDDGTISNNISRAVENRLRTAGSYCNYYYNDDNDAGKNYHYLPTQSGWHTGDAEVGPGKTFIDKIHFGNKGSVSLSDPRACTIFDNTTMKMVDRSLTGGTAGTYAYVGTSAGAGFDASKYTVEYAHIDLTGDDPLDSNGDGTPDYNNQTGRFEGNWNKQKTERCDDASAVNGWHENPLAVTGGIDAINAVRVRVKDLATTLAGGQWIRFNIPLEARNRFNGGPHDGEDIPTGTVMASFGSPRSDEWSPNWYPRRYNPSPENTYCDGDRITMSRVQIRLEQETLEPVASVGNSASTVAGNQIVWKINTAAQTTLPTPPQIENAQIISVLPPEVSYNASCTANYKDANGTVIGTPASLVEYNRDKDGNPAQGYTRLVWNLGTITANNPIASRVICTDSDSLSPDGTSVINYAEIRADGVVSSLAQRSDEHTIRLEQTGSIQVSKKVDMPLDDRNDDQVYTLSWANFASAYIVDKPVIIDVFPYNGDTGKSPPSSFSGNLTLKATPTITWMDGSTPGAGEADMGMWTYTSDSPSTVNINPDENASNWCTQAQFGTAGCPASLADVTAIKFTSNYDLEKDGNPRQGMKATVSLQAGDLVNNSPLANKPGDIYSNQFTLDSTSLPADQFLKSNNISVQVASYSIGDFIFIDNNGNGKYDASIDGPAPDGVVVNLHKASDDSLVKSTTTGVVGSGRYLFSTLDSGDYYIAIPAAEFQPGGKLEGWQATRQSPKASPNDNNNETVDQHGYTVSKADVDGIRTGVLTLSANPPPPGGIPVGNEPMGDNTGGIVDPTGDDFSNLTLDIGLRPVNKPVFTPDHSGEIIPGSTVLYSHQFTSKTGGTVIFDGQASEVVTNGWSHILYRDENCDGKLNNTEADVPVVAALTVVGGEKICLLNKVYAPVNVVPQERQVVKITAKFEDVNANVTQLEVTDITTATLSEDGNTSRLELRKTVQNMTQPNSEETDNQNQAKPGDLLKYRIYYSNTGTGPITDLIIKDAVPAFTTLNAMPVCEPPVPVSLNGCSGHLQGDSIEWIFGAGGKLNGGEKGVVSYSVVID
jgi:uncharacterized repeat protein (TIGR01451 family)